ncbi:MAG: SDR family oxidoreductase [Oscillospiraceae bacterium]|nr:SDR family oxidoreductase [Oscillospiraceae bacterium]
MPLSKFGSGICAFVKNICSSEAECDTIKPSINPKRRHPNGKPEEISKMFIFLASDESSYCTGGFYHVDGWFTGW